MYYITIFVIEALKPVTFVCKAYIGESGRSSTAAAIIFWKYCCIGTLTVTPQ